MIELVRLLYVCIIGFLLILLYIISRIEEKQPCKELLRASIFTLAAIIIVHISMGIAYIVIEKNYTILIASTIIFPYYIFHVYLYYRNR